MRRVGVSSGLRLGEEVVVGSELGVPPPRDLARQLEMLHLILAHRHEIGAIQQDVRGLKDG